MIEALVDRKENTIIEDFGERIVGRFSNETVVDPATGESLLILTNSLTNKSLIKS